MTADILADTDEPQVMRTRALTALAEATLGKHARRVAVEYDQPLDVSPAAALVEVVTNAVAYWTLETAHGPYVVEDYRRIAADMYRIGMEQMPAVVGAHVRAARQAAGVPA